MVRNNTVFRCEYCSYTVTGEDIGRGGCQRCGGKKMKIAFSVTDEEKADLEARGYVFGDNWSDKPTVLTNAA